MRRHIQALASAARTASPTDVTIDVPLSAQAVHFIIDATAIAATPSVVFNIRGVTPVSGTQYLLLASAAVATVSNVQLQIGPGLPVTANLSANAVLPSQLVLDPVHGDADSITYSVQVHFV